MSEIPTAFLQTDDVSSSSIEIQARRQRSRLIYKLPRCYAIQAISIVVEYCPESSTISTETHSRPWSAAFSLLGSRLGVEIEETCSRNHTFYCLQGFLQDGKPAAYFADAIEFDTSSLPVSQIRITLIETALISALRDELLKRHINHSITLEAGFGDIIMGLAYQFIFLYLVGLSSSANDVMILDNAHNDTARRSQIASLSKIVQNIDQRLSSTGHIGGYLPKGTGKNSSMTQVLLDLFSDYYAACVGSSVSSNVILSGGAGTYETICRFLSSSIGLNDKRPKRGHHVFTSLDEAFFSRNFNLHFSLDGKSGDKGDSYVVCHSRLGDTARLWVLGIEIIPYFLDNYAMTHDQWVQSTPSFRANNYTPQSMSMLSQRLFPNQSVRFISDGYSHAREILLKERCLRWISERSGQGITSVIAAIHDAVDQAEATLIRDANIYFDGSSIIGNEPKHNDSALELIAGSVGCISSSGHFCFSVMNFVSRQPQTLYGKQEGYRFLIRRKDLTLRPLPHHEVLAE
ncbi:hypothetical protein [Cyanobium sp. PCC 7001]|uniref:hypothetical protein n=1 Tax=Cyanobium sp. PCC 7001 TaxID=180281 RepID=UPI0012E9C438|nr:hypothetical protein [Cyanobium sp. PCC 7001]